MKKFIRKITLAGAAIVAAAIAFLPLASEAASPRTYLTSSTTDSLVNVPTSVAASTTATNTEIVDVTRQDVIGIQISANLVATNPASQALTIPIHRSIDGTTFETTATTTLSITLDGTLTRTWFTNMTVGAARFLKFNQFVNGTTNIATNITVKITGKPPWSVPVSVPTLN